MHTKRLTTSQTDIEIGGKMLRDGGLVAFPTETVYGLGANAFLPDAVKRIFEAKGRPSDNPLIVHIADKSDVSSVAAVVPDKAARLVEALMPGPLTLILHRAKTIPDAVTAGLQTVAVRIPANDIARRLIRAAGVPVCAPSANISGRPSPTEFRHVIGDLDGRVEAVMDGGSCEIGIESTVLDLTVDPPEILREGGMSIESIRAVIGEVRCGGGSGAPKSPGMKYRHYAPRAAVYVAETMENVRPFFAEMQAKGERCVVLTHTPQYFEDLAVFDAGKDADAYAHNLFSLLRRADEEDYTLIIAVPPTEGGRSAAVYNRLIKASGGKTI